LRRVVKLVMETRYCSEAWFHWG